MTQGQAGRQAGGHARTARGVREETEETLLRENVAYIKLNSQETTAAAPVQDHALMMLAFPRILPKGTEEEVALRLH